jgi:hypothetical protein
MRKLVSLMSVMLATAALVAGMPLATRASSHREAPNTSTDPQVDATDLYAWVSNDRSDSVTFVANYVPMIAPYSGPNFHRFGDDVLYEINIDNNGDAMDDITYQFLFWTVVKNGNTFLYNTGPITSLKDPDLNVQQYYSVSVLGRQPATGMDPERAGTVIASSVQVAPAYVGPASYPEGYGKVAQEAVQDIGNGIKVFAGPRDDPFFVDLGGIFDLLSGIRGYDDLNGLNVMTIAIQVPKAGLRGPNDSIIGVRTSAYRRSVTARVPTASASAGPWVQVSRLDMPLVNEVVIPLALKDAFNAIPPSVDAPLYTSDTDAGRLLKKSIDDPELARLMNGILKINVPAPPRKDIFAIFLTGVNLGALDPKLPNLNQPVGVVPSSQLRLNMDIPPAAAPNRMGLLGNDVAGFPNGRRPADDVVDISLRVVAGATPFTPGFEANNGIGDKVDANDKPFMPMFPYLAEPSGYQVDK